MATKRSSSNNQTKKKSPDGAGLLVLELQEIHSAENQLSRVLPKFAKVVESDTLRKMLADRLSEGERILEEVDGALGALEESPGRKKNVAAEGLINDANEHVEELQPGPALDAVLIGALQKTEHYCIAAWGTAKALAQAVGQKDAARAMERALKEGKSFDDGLTELAEEEVTPALMSESSESEDQDEDEEEEDEDEDEKPGARRTAQRSSGDRRSQS